MANKKVSELTETQTTTGSEYIMIIQDGVNKKIKLENMVQTSDDVTTSIEMSSDDGSLYTMKMKNNGELEIYPSEVDTAPLPSDGDNTLYDGLIINQIYGGGTALVDTPISHGFIELYNMSPSTINLRGIYLWYRAKSGSWQSLALRGIIPSRHSFLVRCQQHNDINASCVVCPIEHFDQEWDIKLTDKGFSCHLTVGNEVPDDNPVRNTKDVNGNITYTNGTYIDLIGAGGDEAKGESIWAYETYYWYGMNNHSSCRRCDFANSGGYIVGTNKKSKGNNQGDCEIVDYNKSIISYYRPRSLKDGFWNEFDANPRLKQYYPNTLNIMYGENGATTRTFTFQTSLTDEGFIKYRKQGTITWEIAETKRQIINHVDGQYTLHKAIITGLVNGIYEYKVGFDGCWSEDEWFEVKDHADNSAINILWTTDEQSWSNDEYLAYRTAMQYIEKNEIFESRLDTGDVSQNANRTFEWDSFCRYSGKATKNMCTFLTCGNNDLIEKKFSDAFNYYTTPENQVYNSVYSWDLGFTHFISLNSNTDSTYVDGIGSIGGFADTNAFLQAQCEWLDAHMTEVNARTTKPKWVIVYMHLSPFTVSRASRLQRFIPVFEKYKIPLVLCGHNHAYSRSKALYTGYNGTDIYNDYQDANGVVLSKAQVESRGADETSINKVEDLANGTHYVMMNATGFKLTGKEKIVSLPNDGLRGDPAHDNGSGQPWWYKENVCRTTTQPTYGMISITPDEISIKIYQINAILETDVNKNIKVKEYDGTQTKYLHDSLTINHSDRI